MEKNDLRIVFMGTPEFAVETLRKLRTHNYNVVGVVTQPDKPVGRHGSILQPSPVKVYAQKYHIPVLQPDKMKDPEFLHQLKALKANLQVVVAFRMLPEVVWNMPKFGTFNVHAALLPQYRGAAPINWAIINGEKKTGVTTFFLDKDIDTGRIICQSEYRIYRTFNVETVYNALMVRGAKLCLETLDKVILSNGYPKSVPQDELVTPGQELFNAPKIFKETCDINWTQSPQQIYNFVRGLSPAPSAWTTIQNSLGNCSMLKIFKTRISSKRLSVLPGTIIVENKNLYVAAKDGELVEITELQLAGKKKMSAKDFLNGNKDIVTWRCVHTTDSV
jgi:methionyl-tRNA formyltransferase